MYTISEGKFVWKLCDNFKTFAGVRNLHIKIEPSEVVRSIAVTEDVTLEKLGFATKEEALKLSPDEVVSKINSGILKIFNVTSKSEIGDLESKDILAKLDSVFRVRVDGQPHVDYPVSEMIEIYGKQKIFLKRTTFLCSILSLHFQPK